MNVSKIYWFFMCSPLHLIQGEIIWLKTWYVGMGVETSKSKKIFLIISLIFIGNFINLSSTILIIILLNCASSSLILLWQSSHSIMLAHIQLCPIKLCVLSIWLFQSICYNFGMLNRMWYNPFCGTGLQELHFATIINVLHFSFSRSLVIC